MYTYTPLVDSHTRTHVVTYGLTYKHGCVRPVLSNRRRTSIIVGWVYDPRKENWTCGALRGL